MATRSQEAEQDGFPAEYTPVDWRPLFVDRLGQFH
jgi:hypothetical protein